MWATPGLRCSQALVTRRRIEIGEAGNGEVLCEFVYNQDVSKRPTITDVARLCGVTAATVSRVLNDRKKNFSTTEAVRQKIWDTARQLGYVPDLSARSLSLRNTRVIGLFASPQTHVAEGINESLLEGIAETLHAGGYDVFFGLSPVRSTKNPLPFWRFDGAVLMQAPKPETVAEMDLRRVPYVCVNERVGRPAAFVLADDAMGMTRAISHLTQLGHKRFAYANARAAYFSHYSVNERYATLLSAGASKRFGWFPATIRLFILRRNLCDRWY